MAAREACVLVLGGPGTGKTTAALWAARDLLDEAGRLPYQRVLFLTFSRSAVAQIARRAPDIFTADRSRIEITTFHGLAWRLISAFGRYAGHGRQLPPLQSEARGKLLGNDPDTLTYDSLIPNALETLKSQRVRRLLARRWPLIICDEFQDTNDQQWTLLVELSRSGRLLLLADPNQMIYTFLKNQGVGASRLEEGRRRSQRVIELGSASHRDPSGAIPAMADAIRRRAFEDPAIDHAAKTHRLRVVGNVADDALTAVITEQVARLRNSGAKTVGIFGHSNQGVAMLGDSLARSGLDHVLVGIPAAQAEAFSALAHLCGFGIGLVKSQEARLGLATFLTSCTRGKSPPSLAVSLARGLPLPDQIAERLDALEQALRTAADGTVGELGQAAMEAWKAIRITRGNRPWRRACQDFANAVRPLASLRASDEAIRRLMVAAERRRPSALAELEASRSSPVQLMNFYQTKGREADAVLLVYRSDDYIADSRDTEPYEEPSRVLFVSLTRGRREVVVVLPRDPHPLVAPFLRWA